MGIELVYVMSLKIVQVIVYKQTEDIHRLL